MLKNGKAPGEDGIAADVLKKGGKVLNTKIKQLIEKYRKTRQYHQHGTCHYYTRYIKNEILWIVRTIGESH